MITNQFDLWMCKELQNERKWNKPRYFARSANECDRVRIYIPNHFGMKQPKWITRMEVIDDQGAGYWVDRGWSEDAIVKTTSVIDNIEVEASDGEMMLSGGIAYAGARGISKVELQVDEGDWNEVELRLPR